MRFLFPAVIAVAAGAAPFNTKPSPPPARATATRRLVTVTTTACAYPSAIDEAKAPTVDPRHCVALTERVYVDADVPHERIPGVEKLTVEDVAVKIEHLLGGEADDVD